MRVSKKLAARFGLITVALCSLVAAMVFFGAKTEAACGLSTDYGQSTTTVNVLQAGSYKIWARLKPASTTNNAAYVQIDGNTCIKLGDNPSLPAGSWSWVNYGQTNNTQSLSSYTFSTGNHSLTLVGSEPDVGLDRVLLLNDSCVPTETGSNCLVDSINTNPNTQTNQPASGSNQSVAQTRDGKPIVSPSNNATVNGNVVFDAAIVNDDSVARVEYYIGKKLVYTSIEKPFHLDTSKIKNGTYEITEKVIYKDGHSTSTTRKITIKNQVPSEHKKGLIIAAIVGALTALLLLVGLAFPRSRRTIVNIATMLKERLVAHMPFRSKDSGLNQDGFFNPGLIVRYFQKKSPARLVTFVVIFAVVMTALLVLTHAASNDVSVEPEVNAISPATVVNDSSASNGKYVKFGSVTSPVVPYKINTWAPQFQGFGTPGVTSDYHPEKFNIVIGSKDIQSSIPTLRANGVKTLIYMNGSFKNRQDLGPNGNDSSYSTDYPESSYAHTASGSRITENDFPSNQLMNPLDATWRNSWYKKCQYFFSLAAYDGCFFDTIGTAPVTASYVSPGLPINPNTNSNWTETSWLDAVNSEVANAKGNLGGKLLYGNGLSNGKRYFQVTSTLMSNLDAAMAEQFVMPKDAGPSDSETDWKANVDMLLDAGVKHKPILAETKAWDGASTATKNARHKYALASFLLGTNTYVYFNFQYDHTTTSPSTWQAWWGTDFGQPTDTYFKHSSGVYVRNFGKAKAVVNPTSATITYSLGASYHPIDSSSYTTSVTLPPRTAEIFLK